MIANSMSGCFQKSLLRPGALLALASVALVMTAGCEKKAEATAALPEVTVLKIEPRDTPIVYEYIAQTQSPQQVNIVARVNGFLDKQGYTEGQIVKEGQLLFQMDQKPFIAALAEAQAGWERPRPRTIPRVANQNRGQAAGRTERAVAERSRRCKRQRAGDRGFARGGQSQRRYRQAQFVVYHD